ncbi:MAG: hypothetical protein JOY72_07205 [Actinobacteria bacterium]|nr:hypothetical protein [Actinomycetota bacterium]
MPAQAAPSPSTIRRARSEVAGAVAMGDAGIAYRRERGRAGDRDLAAALARANAALLADAFELGWWRDEGGSYAHYLLSFSLEWVWEELASSRSSLDRHPWRFRHPGHGMSMAIAYADRFYSHALKPLHVDGWTRAEVSWGRRALSALGGLGTWYPVTPAVYDGRCTPLREWPSTRGRAQLAAFVAGARLPFDTILNGRRLRGNPSLLVRTLLHEETHAGFWRAYSREPNRLAASLEENVVQLFELAVAAALRDGVLPHVDDVERVARRECRHGVVEVIRACAGGGGIRGTCRRARALTVQASRLARESDVAALLNRRAGGRRPVYAWRYALR